MSQSWKMIARGFAAATCAALLACVSRPQAPEISPADFGAIEATRAPSSEMYPLTGESCEKFKKLALDDMNTQGLVFVKDGKILYEWYDGHYTAQTAHPLWSASKTITTTIVAAAIQEGRLKYQDRVAQFFPEANPGANYADVTVGELIEMTSGFDWHETYEGTLQESSILAMLYGTGARDQTGFSLAVPMREAKPGNEFIYSGGNANILSGILKKVYGADYDDLPWRLLFDPLGIKSAVFERDPAGHFLGAAHVFMTPRDMLKIGALYLNDGVWDGRRILPEGWVKQAREIVGAQRVNKDGAAVYKQGLFGRTIWLNDEIPENGVERQFPDVPTDTFLASGHQGQSIVVIPSAHVLIARTGHDENYWMPWGKAIRQALRCFAGAP